MHKGIKKKMDNIIHKIKGYLGYGVKCEYLWTAYDNKYITNSGIAILDDILFDKGEGNYKYIYIKPILRPLESLTDEEIGEIHTLIIIISFNKKEFIRELKAHIHQRQISYDLIEYLHSIHIDYQDLIGQGLAVELIKGE